MLDATLGSRPSPDSKLAGRLIGNRYLVESALGTGGMAAVFAARDTATGARVALKVITTADDRRRRSLFEREFYELVALRHPNIVEAYDYGVDGHRAYYAMELLEGADLGASGPRAWREVAQILRDVASALALIHARRLVHRDLSHRNVWRTVHGHTKLIDFGALASFGNASEIVGTAPFLAPEALVGRNLDQRTDLYALGALGYRLLTGTHAYPAKNIGDLPETWLRAVQPASVRVRALARPDLPEVPLAFDDLIASLLRAEAAERPGSAAEVLERASAMAGLATGPVPGEADAYLSRTAFVGRTRERKAFRSAIKRAADGPGKSFLFEGLPGSGRTRLLGEFALDARFAQCVVLQADALAGSGPHYLGVTLGEQLIKALPVESRRAAASLESVLGHLSPSLRSALFDEHQPLPSLPTTPGEARVRLQGATLQWFRNVVSERPIVILVDDAHLLDNAARGFLAALARDCAKRRWLVATTSTEATDPSDYTMHALRQAAPKATLSSLDEQETLALVRSVFGDVQHVQRVARCLWNRAQGNPAHTMELAQYLVTHGHASYSGASWTLQGMIDDSLLPCDRREVAWAMLARLSTRERELARALSVPERAFSLAESRVLSDCEPATLFEHLRSLVAKGVLIGANAGYRFVQGETRAILNEELTAEQRRKAHLALGRFMLDDEHIATSDRLRAGLHLMMGGAIEYGSHHVADVATRLSTAQYADTGDVAAELELALRLFREHGFPEAELVPLLCAIAQAGYYGDRRLASAYGEAAMRSIQRVARLHVAVALRPYVGRRIALYVALCCASFALALSRRRSTRVPSLAVVIRSLLGAGCALAGTATICADSVAAARFARFLEPLTALGPNHAASVLHTFCENLSLTVQDRPALANARWKQFIQRMESADRIRDLPDDVRVFYLGGALYALGVVECWRESPRALEIAARLENLSLRLYALGADQLRAYFYALQGDEARYAHYRERVDSYAAQRGTAWQVEVWAPAAMLTVHLRTQDATRVKECLEQLKQVQAESPSLSLCAARAAGAYALLRGDSQVAVALLQQVLAEPTRGTVGWARQLGALAQACNRVGNHEMARSACERALKQLSRQDLDYTAMNLGVQVERALASAYLGDTGSAVESLDALLSRHTDKGPVTRGILHDARALVAALAGDVPMSELHARARLQASAYLNPRSPVESQVIARGPVADTRVERRSVEEGFLIADVATQHLVSTERANRA